MSRNADVGVGGNVPLFTLWDKTTGPQKVRGIMSFSRGNMFLLTVDPQMESMRDFKDTDRIAMTDVRSTTYSMVIQMAAAKEYGWDQRTKYDRITVAMGNNEALAAMLSGRMEVKSHMTILPHSTMELNSGKVRILLNSKDLLGEPYTTVASFATTRFKQENPVTYQAVVAGLQEAIDFINTNAAEAADIFLKNEKFTGIARRTRRNAARQDRRRAVLQLHAEHDNALYRLHVQVRHAQKPSGELEGPLVRKHLGQVW